VLKTRNRAQRIIVNFWNHFLQHQVVAKARG